MEPLALSSALPERLHRSRARGPLLTTLRLHLSVVTPILGGAAQVRSIDEVDVIRVPSLRGQLRFWWRALHSSSYSRAEELWDAEARLWGCAGSDDGSETGRSDVRLRLSDVKPDRVDSDDLKPGNGKSSAVGLYSLFPSFSEKKGNVPPAPRRLPGTTFTLEVRYPADPTLASQVEDSLKAWILFGGYGSRTRRGLGSLTLTKVEAPDEGKTLPLSDWLPDPKRKSPEVRLHLFLRQELERIFGRDVLAPLTPSRANDTSVFAGAGLLIGNPNGDAMKCWVEALDRLRDFRQGEAPRGANRSGQSYYARANGEVPRARRRPGRSFWPEPDKIRQLTGQYPPEHTPRFNREPAWPRASFGLPIIGRFQQKSRFDDAPYHPKESDSFQLLWRDARGASHDRLASPLIVKALPLADGSFVAAALWLYRAFPHEGKVVLDAKVGERYLKQEGPAEFDLLSAKGDDILYTPLELEAPLPPQGCRLRTAYFTWLEKTHSWKKVA